MDIKTTKIELAKLILNLENPSMIEKIKDLLKSEAEDFADSMTKFEKEEINIAMEFLKEEKRVSFDDFLKRVS